MGFALAWLAIRGSNRDEVLSTMGLLGTGQHEEIPESDLVGASLPNGWYLVVANHFGPLESDDLAQRLSKRGETIACWVEEHTMFSMSCGFTKGREIWRVTHESDRGLTHLDVSGTPPPSFEEIRTGLLHQQSTDTR